MEERVRWTKDGVGNRYEGIHKLSNRENATIPSDPLPLKTGRLPVGRSTHPTFSFGCGADNSVG
ncbi:hypothetical protein DSCA_49800 [Desulfosarcina alkanivorans]|uniref:Uncharacterized protein n=1 Tax=Desulfosarcina alkanivorans TaxID=571177 RepID=A0A5K7YRR1_9BACT|nr:hypothetical protein DSCA_49800 [Desulfosarcina alkanivorans]